MATAFTVRERREPHLLGIIPSYSRRKMVPLMRNRYTKGALISAILPLGLLLSGCGGMMGEGHPGYDEFKAGDYQAAKVDFTHDINKRPNSPIAQFNIGDSYHQEGDIGQ